MERYITGATGQLHLYPRDIAKIIVPVVEPEQQQQFEEFSASAVAAQRQAKQLLETAKRAVEIAIEESEAAALAFLEQHSTTSDAGEDKRDTGLRLWLTPSTLPHTIAL